VTEEERRWAADLRERGVAAAMRVRKPGLFRRVWGKLKRAFGLKCFAICKFLSFLDTYLFITIMIKDTIDTEFGLAIH